MTRPAAARRQASNIMLSSMMRSLSGVARDCTTNTSFSRTLSFKRTKILSLGNLVKVISPNVVPRRSAIALARAGLPLPLKMRISLKRLPMSYPNHLCVNDHASIVERFVEHGNDTRRKLSTPNPTFIHLLSTKNHGVVHKLSTIYPHLGHWSLICSDGTL